MADSSRFEVRLLGPIEVVDRDGTVMGLGTRKQRALLTILALARGQIVSADRLVDDLWGDDPPTQALTSLYAYVSNLRRLLEPRRDLPPTTLMTVPPGYVLHLDPEALDVVRFEHESSAVASLITDGDWTAARTRAERALAWWRGPALGEFADEPFADLDRACLDEMRLAMSEDLFHARVELHDGHVIADVERFVGEHPTRERAWALLMRALYAAGRQSDALRAYQRARRYLMDELGVEPGPHLRDLERSILRHDDHLEVTRTSVGRPPDARSEPADGPIRLTPGAQPGSGAPLVGRDGELAICRAVLEEATSGPRAIVVEGDAGIGKTRLVEELADIAGQRGMTVLWGRCLDGSAPPALWPWLPLLRTLVELDGDDAGHGDGERRGGDVARFDLAALLASAPPDGHRAQETDRFLMFDAIVTLIERVARRHPLMLVIDDLQWADIASIELVVTLATRLSSPGVLLAVTTRELDVGRTDVQVAALASLTRMAGSRRLKLTGLDHDDTAALLAELAGGAADPQLTAAVFERAEGNAFFTIEIARLLAGGERDHGGPADIPHSVRDVILRRLDPMPPDTLTLLRDASVVGREFDVNVLTRTSGHRDLLACLEHLEPAVLQRLVVDVDEHPGTYRFVHALVRDVLVDDQTALQLAKAHLRIADVLDPSDDTVELIAEHLWEAIPLADGRRTAEQLERASHVAIGRGAYEAAQDRLQRAVDLYRTSCDPPDRDGEARALTLLASVSVFRQGFTASDEAPVLAQARDLAGDARDVRSVVLRFLEFANHNTGCDFPAADAIAAELRSVADTSDDPLIRSIGHTAYGCSCWYHGRLREAATHLQHSVEALDDRLARPERAPDDVIQMLYFPAAVLVHVRDLMGELEDPAAAADEVRRALPGDPLWELIVSLYASLGALMVGDPERAIREAERGIDRDPDAAFGVWSAGLRICHTAARCAGGRDVDGRAILHALEQRYDAGTQRATLSIIFAALSMGLARSGQAAAADHAAARARGEIGPHHDLNTEPLVLLAEATVAAARPDGKVEAARLVATALAITERQGAKAVAAHVGEVATLLGLETPRPPGTATA